MPIASTTIATGSGTYQTVSSISEFSLIPYLPNNDGYSILVSGTVATNLGYAPVTGAMIESGVNYILQINIGTSAVTCIIASSSLNGICAPSNSGIPYAVTYDR
jgi:hypothetical protein